ncbi:hypothetical protein CEP53_012753 [Fusarium sp. AF-6]|nr:hypothetical protein CEP53_012753 [Fusarium sp. AF-6]
MDHLKTSPDLYEPIWSDPFLQGSFDSSRSGMSAPRHMISESSDWSIGVGTPQPPDLRLRRHTLLRLRGIR